MSLWRVQLNLIVPNTVDGETVKAAVETDLAGKSVFDQPAVLSVRRSFDGLITRLGGHIRFNLLADAQAFFDTIQTRWKAGPLRSRILVGSRLSIHRCLHDEPESNWLPCSTQSFILVVK